MKLGIKTGLLGNPKEDLLLSQPDFTEIWFHAGKIDQYDSLFAQLDKQGIPAGLHFWGTLVDGTLTNFAYPDKEIIQQSINLVKKTIDTAVKHGCLYVNLHPHGTRLTKVDFTKDLFLPYTQPANLQDCIATLTESISDLADYADKKGVILILESVPKHALSPPWHGKAGRLKPITIGEISITDINDLFYKIPHVYFANDFGHTAASVVSKNKTEILDFVKKITQDLADKTRLLHIAYILPPYNGTDYHGCIYYDEFKSYAAVPNYFEMQDLLRNFKNRDDVYALVEPEKDHPGNFEYLKKLVSEL